MPIIAAPAVTYVPTTHTISRSKVDAGTWYWVGKPSWCGPLTVLQKQIAANAEPGKAVQWRATGTDTQRLYVAG